MTPTSPPSQPSVLGIGMLGYGFMGRAHSQAFRSLAAVSWPPPAIPRLVAICGRHRDAVSQARDRFGYNRAYTDWRDLVADPEVQILDCAAPNNLHAGPSIAAAAAGKHVISEKPLARNAAEARAMLEAVTTAGVKHLTGFNYRFVPALRLAYDHITSGELGEILGFRGVYLKGGSEDPVAPIRWRHKAEIAGTGTLGDLGSHLLDLIRWLAGEIETVDARTRTFVRERPSAPNSPLKEPVTVDDAAVAILELGNGALGTLESSRLAPGHPNGLSIEINGTRGSLAWSLERMNELRYFSKDDPPHMQGFRDVLVTEPNHPYYSIWRPRGHVLGWADTFVHELIHFLEAVARDTPVAPFGATFEDGYRNAVIVDAILESSRSGRRVYLDREP